MNVIDANHTKITIGLAVALMVAVGGFIFSSGFFLAKQESLERRMLLIEDKQETFSSVGKDIALIQKDISTLTKQIEQLTNQHEVIK